MSNDEATPVLTAEAACIEEATLRGVELLLPREVPLGGPRALPVLRGLPNKYRHMIGAWCFADTFGPVDLSKHAPMEVPPHPHTGLQTVSWLVAGSVEHRDSVGSTHIVEPGGVNVMTAGHGISHSEYSTPETTSLHGVQLWVALPGEHRDIAPAFDGLDEVPSTVAGDATVRVFAGQLGDLVASVPTYTPLVGAEVAFTAAGTSTIDVDPSFEHGFIALTDGLSVDGVPIARGGIVVIDAGRDSLTVNASGADVAILIGGKPFEEEIVMFWNFIGKDHDSVAAARETWMAERDEAPGERERFGTVADDRAPSLPSPRVPDVELLPRGRAKRRS